MSAILSILKTILLVNLGESFAKYLIKKIVLLSLRYLAKKADNNIVDEIVDDVARRLR